MVTIIHMTMTATGMITDMIMGTTTKPWIITTRTTTTTIATAIRKKKTHTITNMNIIFTMTRKMVMAMSMDIITGTTTRQNTKNLLS